jgi:hypothetical protein
LLSFDPGGVHQDDAARGVSLNSNAAPETAKLREPNQENSPSGLWRTLGKRVG